MMSDLASADLTTTSWNLFSTMTAFPHEEAAPLEPVFAVFPPAEAKVVIIDDQSTNIEILEAYLKQEGYERFVGSTDSTRALELIEEIRPDIVLLDVNMPVVDGHTVLEGVRSDVKFATMPVLVLTASDDAKTRRRSLELGATDFLSKPVHRDELIQRVRNALALRFHQRELAQYANRLELLVRERTEQLLVAQREAIHCLARASEYRDHETGRHVLRVGRYSGIIARQLAKGEAYAEALELAATLHDVGKIAVPDTILLKAGGARPRRVRVDPAALRVWQPHVRHPRPRRDDLLPNAHRRRPADHRGRHFTADEVRSADRENPSREMGRLRVPLEASG